MNLSVLMDRFCSGERNEGNVLSAPHCRWCGTGMTGPYPKDGRALTHRCCSALCQIMHAACNLHYFCLPLMGESEIDFRWAVERLAEYGVKMHARRYPAWFRQASEEDLAGRRHCQNERDGKPHFLPPEARANQSYCDRACRQGAYRLRRAA